MRLLPNWRRIITRAWSMRFMYAAAVCSAVEVVFAIVGPLLPLPVGIFAALSGLFTFAGVVSRIIAQRNC